MVVSKEIDLGGLDLNLVLSQFIVICGIIQKLVNPISLSLFYMFGIKTLNP
jgi:hypothetical protein